MAYRRFRFPEVGSVPRPATLSGETDPTVADAATVASPKSIFGPERLGTVANIASVARAKPKSELRSFRQSSVNGQALDSTIFSCGSATVATPATVSGVDERATTGKVPAAYARAFAAMRAAAPPSVPASR